MHDGRVGGLPVHGAIAHPARAALTWHPEMPDVHGMGALWRHRRRCPRAPLHLAAPAASCTARDRNVSVTRRPVSSQGPAGARASRGMPMGAGGAAASAAVTRRRHAQREHLETFFFFVRQSKQRESSLFSMLSGRRARSEQLGRLAVHVEIASRINKAIEERALVALGKLEQDLVFGDATSKEVIAFLAGHGATPAQEKARAALPPPAALRRGGMDRAHPVPPHPAASDAPAPRRRAASPVSASEAAGEAGRGVVCPCLPCRSAAASRRPQPAPPARPK